MGWLSEFVRHNKNIIKPVEQIIGEKTADRVQNSPEAVARRQASYASSPAGREAKLRDELTDEAKKFRSNIGNYANEQYSLLQQDADQALKEGIKNTRRNFNSRGLLYSGLRQGAEGDIRSQVASGLSGGRVQINKDLEDSASAKERQAASVGLQSYGAALQSAENLYNAQLQNAILRRKALSSLGAGLGYAAGAYYGGKSSSPDSNVFSDIGASPYNQSQYSLGVNTDLSNYRLGKIP